jgi:hypothetical protein
MAESIDVNLPKTHRAEFPDRCVVCGRDDPDSHVRLVTGSIGWWSWLLWWFSTPFMVKAPACDTCGWKLQGLRLLSLLVTVAISVAVIWFGWPLVKDSVPQGLQKWALMGLAVICLLPQIIFEVFYAPPFDITAFSASVDYEFTSPNYATEFALLNRDAEWVKIDGESLE